MKNKEETYKCKGFKLLSLSLKGNSLTGKSDLEYDFVDENDEQNIIYTTVLIGANGTGKSNLFRIVIELFKELYDLSVGKKRSYKVDGNFKLKFSLDGDIFEYTNESDTESENGNLAFLLRNGIRVDFDVAQFPSAIVANSIMLTDKFPFYRKENSGKGEKVDAFPLYKYLGARDLPQSASTRAYVRRTVEFIVEQFDKKDIRESGFINNLRRATAFLELDNYIDIIYKPLIRSVFFNARLTPSSLDEYFEQIRKKYLDHDVRPPFKLNHYLKIKGDSWLIRSICDFCNGFTDTNGAGISSLRLASSIGITYNLIEEDSFEKLSKEYFLLEHMRQLGIVSSPEIGLKRTGGYSLQESSSGEYHFFSSVVGLMATVKAKNSLIIIDEPEISLHPNWQMAYLSFLRDLFSHSDYASCHILVATHSHFLISDLKGDSSKIIGLKRADSGIEIIDLPKDLNTFGWSAEDVLYNVFNVASTRNKFVAEDIANILNHLSSGNTKKINKLSKEKYDKLLYLEAALKENDPLKRVVNTILNKVSK
ncbi:AAA family ATPase [Elizabethkingia anophelis]|nr:AAA family ATPase [Elizabethkingia anophelis]MCT4058155.1 AAA family ATPase [Elizabethkingia anophelis]MCT4068764.1 AAA family ATPase [Elizabethkingia anophelis]